MCQYFCVSFSMHFSVQLFLFSCALTLSNLSAIDKKLFFSLTYIKTDLNPGPLTMEAN